MKPGPLKSLVEPNLGLLLHLALILGTLSVYAQVAGFEFTNYDDPQVVFENPIVTQGLTGYGLRWALFTSYFDFWRPVSWWSHMLDCELFQLRSGGHHLVNLGLHMANTSLLFAILTSLTGARLRSAVVAALFALHPTHVESVAWVAERKDVLSTFFCFWSLWFYVKYVKALPATPHKSGRDYGLMCLFFGLALAAKSMVVTLPFVLLLLDYWPLGRMTREGWRLKGFWPLVREKFPLVGLTVASSVITWLSMRASGCLLTAEKIPWSFRLTNTAVSYVRYVGTLLWPVDLVPCYPSPGQWEIWRVAGAVVILVLVTVLVIRWLSRAPYLAVGWFIFLGTLVPVIGIVAMSRQSIADRYLYIPAIGIFIAGVWAAGDAVRRWRFPMIGVGGVTTAILLACGFLTWRQVGYWRNSIGLWNHCVALTPQSVVARNNLGDAWQRLGNLAEAEKQFREVVRLQPDYLFGNLNLGTVCYIGGRLGEATNHLGRALTIEPECAKAHLYLGHTFYKLKRYAEATNHYAQATRIEPHNPNAGQAYALALIESGDFRTALNEAERLRRLMPGDIWAELSRGRALSGLGRSEEAMTAYYQVLGINPNCAEAHDYIGREFMKRGQADAAVASFNEALRINPGDAATRLNLAAALGAKQPATAIPQYREVLRLEPDNAAALNNLAWILATSPIDELRNGREAVQLAARACELTGANEPVFLGTLAAAHAEAGDFEKARDYAQAAARLALSLGQTNMFERNQESLKVFQRREPLRSRD